MNTIAVIQARMGSTRLPGKVLQDIAGVPMLQRVVERTRRSCLLSKVVVATSTNPGDEQIVHECSRIDVPCFRGSESDVLDRYYKAAEAFKADVVVRITSDCPLIDPAIIDKTIRAFQESAADYASNAISRTYPRGLDTEVFSMSGLRRCWQQATLAYERSHVTPYFYQNPEKFRLLAVTGEQDLSQHRWTVDTAEDLEFVRAIYDRLVGQDDFGWHEVLAIIDREPQLAEINSQIQQKPLTEG